MGDTPVNDLKKRPNDDWSGKFSLELISFKDMFDCCIMNLALLMILSDVDGLYSADPHKDTTASLIGEVYGMPAWVLALGGDKGSALGTGGMKTKLHAAQIAAKANCDTVISNGENPETLYDIVAGKSGKYTRFYSSKTE